MYITDHDITDCQGQYNLNSGKFTAIVSVLLLLMYCAFLILYERHAHKAAQHNIEKHALVVANALWNFNPQGASEYLSIACKLQNYEHVTVKNIKNEVFQKAFGSPPGPADRFFIFLGLIPSVNLTTDIVYNDKMIGEINAVWHCTTIYKELLILFVTILFFLIFQLYVWLLHSRRVLEERVLQRTNELSILNDSLQLEVKKHRSAREALFKSEELYRLIADNAADVIWIADMNLHFTYISPSVYQQNGYTNKEAMTHSMTEIMTPDSIKKVTEIYNEKTKLIQADDPAGYEPIIFEIEQYCRDGSTIWTSNNVRFLKGDDGKPKEIIGVTRDITKQIQAEKEKLRAERHAAEQEKHALVGQIAGKMSHDFNNILSVIMGNVELSLLDCKDEGIKKTLELILGQTLQGKNLTKNLIAFAKDQEPNQEFFQLNKKIDLVVKLLKKDLEGIKLISEKDPDLPLLLADSGMIEHALVNLIQNSIHALGKVEKPELTIRSYCSDENIYIEIEDNGCGIPKEHIDHIYEPSFTLKGSKDTTGAYKSGIKGTGYGMANIIRYVDQHNGRMSVESTVNTGTKFTISLPITRKELSASEKTEIEKTTTHSEKNILLVEDEKTISEIQFQMLTKEPLNHKVDTAHTGQTAIDLFNKNQYDIISLDYVLPGNINGMDVYHFIRKTNKSVPILFISGNIEFLESIKELKNKDPFVGHLSKPCKNVDYINSINKLISSAC